MATFGVTTSITRALPDGVRGRMRVVDAGKPPKRRTSFQVLGIAQPTLFGVHNNNLTNLRRGLVERVFAVEGKQGLEPPLEAASGVYGDALMAEFRRLVADYVGPQTPGSYASFLECYKGDRRYAVYSAAVESLKQVTVNRQDAYLTTFVKCEKINFSAKDDPAPRVIQPRTPRYNVEVGCYLKKLEKKVCKAVATIYGGPTVMKGYNAAETAQHLVNMWGEFNDPVAVGLDASRFDQHTGESALRWEHSVYTACYRGADAKRLATLLDWQIQNEGCARAQDGHIKYKVNGCRMSGDMNTSLGNCLIMCALVWKLAKTLGIRVRLANNGDDCVVFMERRDLKVFSAAVMGYFRNHGYSMKVEDPSYSLEEIEFCQTRPVCVNGKWRMVRNGLTAMAKDAVSVLPMEQGKVRWGWCTAIGECGMALSGGVPIFQEFYAALCRAGRGHRLASHPALESGFARLASGMRARYEPVTDDTRVSFWKAYGIMPTMQVELENSLKNWEFDGFEVHRREILSPDYSFLQSDYQR